MTVIDRIDRDSQPTGHDTYTPPASSRYEHTSFTAELRPDLARVAWQVQAQGYRAAGFVSDEAITPEGYLAPEIDASRFMAATYYLAHSLTDSHDIATARKVHIPDGGTYRDLPAHKLCEGQPLPILDQAAQAGMDIKEISALAGTASHDGVHEIIRRMVIEGTYGNEVWFCGLVSTTHAALTRKWGEGTLASLGDSQPIEDGRVNQDVKLVPVVMRPAELIENILRAYETAEEPVVRERLKRSFLFYSDGMPEDLITARVRAARGELLG